MAGSSCFGRRLPARAFTASACRTTPSASRTSPAPTGRGPGAAATGTSAGAATPAPLAARRAAGAPPARSSLPSPRGSGLARGARARRLRARSRGPPTFTATLSGRAPIGLLPPPRAALLPASSFLIYRSPGTPLGLPPRNTTLLVARFDMLSLALLLVRVRGLVASGHNPDLR